MIEIEGVHKVFHVQGRELPVLRDFSLTVEPREFLTLVGPSGCGKSTLLNLISGLMAPTSGEIRVHGRPVRGVNSHVGYLFQKDALVPWKTVEQNVLLPTQLQRMPRKRAQEAASYWIELVGLKGFERYYPGQLSGGMRKRVSLAMTLIAEPEIILMDEPFGSLDVQTRDLLENELLRLWEQHRATIVFVTHDLEEAIALADRVVVCTARPATVKGVYPIDLPRPRDVHEIRTDPRFTELYRRIWSDLREEVLLSYHGQGKEQEAARVE